MIAVEESLALLDVLPVRSRLVIGASGGLDSQVLVHALARHSHRFELHLAHLHHGVRAADADADAELVKATAHRVGAAFHLRYADVRARARRDRQGLEAAGRQERREFFLGVALPIGAAVILTAHHADDQAETVWMNLLRGSGLQGLRGMSLRCGIRWRPLLGARRSRLQRWAEDHAVPWREDSSNEQMIHLRNRVRKWMRNLALRGLDPVPGLCALAQWAGDEWETLQERMAGVWPRVASDGPEGLALHRAEWKALPVELADEVVREAWRRISGEHGGFSRLHVEAVRRILTQPAPNARVSLPDGVVAFREYGRLRWTRRDDAGMAGWRVPMARPGSWDTPVGTLRVEMLAAHRPDGSALHLDIGSAGWPLVLRSPRSGDRFVPLGMSQPKRVARFLMDAALPQAGRRRAWVVEQGGRVMGVGAPGMTPRPDQRFRITPQTREMVTIRAETDPQALAV